MKKSLIFILLIGLVFLISFVNAGPLEDIQNLQPGEWYEIPNSKLSEAGVFPDPIPPGNTGVQSVIIAESSGVYDTKRDRLLIWGGGHADYSGNEIYAFDMNTFSWSRIWGPSTNDMIGCTENYSVQDCYDDNIPKLPDCKIWMCDGTYEEYFDGNPSSRHTWNRIVYIPEPIDAILDGGGSGRWRLSGVLDFTRWMFHLEELQWEMRGNSILDCSKGIAYDAATGKVFCRGRYAIQEYDIDTDTYTIRHNHEWIPSTTAAIDPITREMLFIGSALHSLATENISVACGLGVFDLDTYEYTQYAQSDLTGDTEIVCAVRPGFDYDPIINKFVVWSGEPITDGIKKLFSENVYLIDPETLVVEKRYPAATNSVIPTESPKQGTCGRFRYVPSKNVYIVVNSIYENVYVYRLSDGFGPECNDTIDNDGDGFCDTIGATCTDGSIPGDEGCDSLTDSDETNCGDLVCEGGENCQTCTQDCPTGAGQVCCLGVLYTGDCCDNSDCTFSKVCKNYVCSEPGLTPGICNDISLLMHFDEDSSIVIDDSGNGNNGAVNGAIFTSLGKFNGAFEYNGEDDYVEILNDASLQFNGQAFSTSSWINLADVLANSKTILSKDDLNYGNEFPWVVRVFQSTLYFAIKDITSITRTASSSGIFSAGNWFHVATTFDPAGYMTVYVNGAQSGTSLNVSGFTFDSSSETDPLTIGKLAYADAYYFNGSIDEVAVWNRSLSSQEVLDLYNSGGPIICETTSCSSGADLPPYDNLITINEVINYIGEWKANNVIINDVMIAIGEWKNGCS